MNSASTKGSFSRPSAWYCNPISRSLRSHPVQAPLSISPWLLRICLWKRATIVVSLSPDMWNGGRYPWTFGRNPDEDKLYKGHQSLESDWNPPRCICGVTGLFQLLILLGLDTLPLTYLTVPKHVQAAMMEPRYHKVLYIVVKGPRCAG